ncbi:hypothetical protein EG329_012398 [Mollisiaceae sp. DMI_Dod_QoI]|nr:hypothetical protein EG329_012398 [Helotiales sp. DMI_Dod_QoI]
MEHSTAALNASEEIKPYRIHVSSKYLELTKKKLELTRLPHELLLPKAREWEFGTPKGVVEPLIDFWLEHYTWRSREEALNTALPQFRTAIALPPSATTTPEESSTPKPPLRIHFIHLRSPHPHAIPLLLLPPFPLTNLSLSSSPIFAQLTNPESPTSTQAFHIICPSIPGLGFSDAFTDPSCHTSNSTILDETAYLFNTLMLRLGYNHYLCSTTGSGRESPAGVDYHLARILGSTYPENCLAVHVVEPCISPPRMGKEILAWMKYNVAKFFHANIWGYASEDWTALRVSTSASRTSRRNETRHEERRSLIQAGSRAGCGNGYGAISVLGLREPTTLSYALCDSPVGLLSLICSALQRANPEHKLSEEQIIDITQLAWLPGPEAGMRFWATAVKDFPCLSNLNSTSDDNRNANELRKRRRKSRIAITVFNADGSDSSLGYICPAWASNSHDLVFAQRVPGNAGLTIWERSDVLLAGIRGLAGAMDALDPAFRIHVRTLEGVVVPRDERQVPVVEESREEEEGHGMQLDVESPDTIVAADIS